MFNNRLYHEMPLIAQMLRLRAEQPQETFYSNYVDAVWFYTASQLPLSFVTMTHPLSMQAGRMISLVTSSGSSRTSISIIAPQKIAEFADVKLVYEGKGWTDLLRASTK